MSRENEILMIEQRVTEINNRYPDSVRFLYDENIADFYQIKGRVKMGFQDYVKCCIMLDALLGDTSGINVETKAQKILDLQQELSEYE